MAKKVNLFSVDNGKITFNSNISQTDITEINAKNTAKKSSTLKNDLNVARNNVITSKTNLANYLNKNGQNVSASNPLSANIISNRLIDSSKRNLNGRVTLYDVVSDYNNVMSTEKATELKNDLRLSENEMAWAKYNYNVDKVQKQKTTLWDKTGGNVTRGIKDLFSTFDNGYRVKKDDGSTIILPSYNDLKQQKVSGDYNTKVGKFLGDTTYNVSKILGSEALNVATFGVGGSTLYWSDMFADSYKSAISGGYDDVSALSYALAGTTAEFITGKILGSATKGLTGGKTSELSNAISNGIYKLTSNPKFSSVLGNALSEGSEEFIQEYLDNINKLITLDGSTNIEDYIEVITSPEILQDAIYSAGVGMVSGGLLNVGEAKNISNNTKSLEAFKIQLEESRKKTTDQDLINKYTSAIDGINEYLKKPFGNENNNYEKTVYDLIENTKTNVDTDTQTDTQTGTQIQSEMDNIRNQIEEYEQLKSQNKLTKSQREELNNLNKELVSLQQQLQEVSDNTIQENSNIKNNAIPTVENIVQQNRLNTNTNINLPSAQTNGKFDSKIKSNTNALNVSNVDDLTKSNINTTPIRNNLKISPKTAEIVSNLKSQSNPNITYTGNNISLALKETGIEIPASFKYVDKVNADLTYTTTRKLSRQDNIAISNALNQLRSVDPTSINNTNQVLAPVDISQIKHTKGNIPINQELFGKYKDATEIFANEKLNFDGNVKIENNIPEVDNIDINKISDKDAKKLAREIFHKYHNQDTFINNGNKIKVTNSGIDESITKIKSIPSQKKLLKEHLKVFSDLGDIIENSKLVSQGPERKSRGKHNSWNYYFNGLSIGNDKYSLEFEVVNMDSGENHYRLQRLEKNEELLGDVNKNVEILPIYNSSFSDNNITQVDKNVKLPIVNTNNMQNNEINTNKKMNPIEISNLTQENANSTPILPTKKVSTGKGNSNFASNIANKTSMLNDNSKDTILENKEVNYYKEVTNKESLEKAYDRLNENGESEVMNWLSKDSAKADSTDVAEGWILLKQYQDKIAQTSDISKKDDLNRSMVQVAKKMREMGTKAGQTVQAYNILNRLTPEGMVYYAQSELSEAYDRMIKNKSKEWIDKHREDFDLKPDEVQFIMDTMKEVSKMEDGYDKRVKLAEIQKLMTDKLPPEKGAGIRSWMRISMLFNPKTQVRNVAGNALIMPVNSFSDLFSSYADKIISKKTGVRTTGNTNIKAMLKGMKKGAYEATNDYKKGINTKDMEGNRFEISEGKAFNDKTIIGKNLNRTESLLNYVMDVGDRVFSEASFENSLQNQMILNNTTEITQEMIDIAHEEALSRTWNDNNDYTRFVLGVRKGLNNLGGNAKIFGYGLGDVLIPFAKTPANLTKAIVDYSPAGLVNTITSGINLKKSLSNGQYTAKMQHEFVQNLGKATAGTMLYVLGFALAKAGITSGDSDDDKDVANFLKNTLGINSYSIKIGDKSFTYDWAQPLAAPLAITANIVQKEKENATLYENIISSLNTAGNILLEQSFLDSLNTVLTNNEGIATGIQEAILELPSRAIPTFSKQIADLVDGTQRQTFEKDKPLETAINKVKAKIPGLSNTLAPSVDTMGREIKKYGGKNNIFNVFLNPANVNTENISKSAKEIYRLYKETGETNIMPRVAPYYINQNGEKIVLNAEQRTEYQKVSGKIIEDNIEKLLKTTEYKNMSDKEKAEVINDIVNYSYNIAKKEVLGIDLSDAYEKAYNYSKIGNISDYYTFKANIDDTNKYTKKTSITNYLINSNLNNKQLAFLYGSYYSSEETLNNLIKANIPIKEFIKFNSQTFESDYYDNGKTVSNSRKKKVINYINSLNLTIPQKAILIKMEYSSYNDYNSQIVNYINKMDYSKYEKACILKQIGFGDYDSYIIETVNKKKISISEKVKILEDLGFKIRNGKVYSK